MPLLLAVTYQSKVLGAGAVFHGGVIAWAVLADGTDSTTTLEVAIVGALAVVLAAALPALIGLFRTTENDTGVKDLRKQRDDWMKTAKAAIRGTEVRDVEIERLRGMVVDLGGNPFPHRVVDSQNGATP